MAGCGHNHIDDKATSDRLFWALIVIATFMILELVGGLLSGSLALIADAAHMFTDAAALGLALLAQQWASRPATSQLHFGYRRIQVLAAFTNGVVMACLLIWILVEAVSRLITPVTVEPTLMFWVAVAGLGANILAFMILYRRAEHNLNMRGATLHVLGDLLGSLAAILAALAIRATGWMWVDPALSIVVVGLISVATFRLLRDSGHILLEGAPKDIDLAGLASAVKNASPDIVGVHNIRIWQLTPEHPTITLHLCVSQVGDAPSATTYVKNMLEKEYGIAQSTIQVEIGEDCPDRYTDQVEAAPGTVQAVDRGGDVKRPDPSVSALLSIPN